MENCELLDMYKKKPAKIAIEVYTDTKANPPIATRAITRETYSCNQCEHCKAVCPKNISMGELFSMSRQQRRQSGDAPGPLPPMSILSIRSLPLLSSPRLTMFRQAMKHRSCL